MRLYLRFVVALWFLTWCGAARAAMNVLVVDPADSETGRACARALSELREAPAVRRIDLAHVDGAGDERWDAVVWLQPEPSLYHDASLALWRRVTGDATTGLVIIGQPHDDAGKAAMFQSLQGRGAPRPGAHLSKHLEGATWIWADKSHDDQHVYFRRRFELKEIPARCWLQLAADNAAEVHLNGMRVGACESWRRPASINLQNAVKAGVNVLAVEATNQDGPAGLIGSVTARSASGDLLLDVHTDRSWKQIEPDHPDTNWRGGADFDDSAWRPAREIGPLGGGYWEDKLLEDYVADEHDLHVPPGSARHPCLGADSTGPVVVLDGVTPGEHCTPLWWADGTPVAVAGEGDRGRLVLLSAEPELSRPIDPFLDDDTTFATRVQFRSFLSRATQWVGGAKNAQLDSGPMSPWRPGQSVRVVFPSHRWTYAAGEKVQVAAALRWAKREAPPRGHLIGELVAADGRVIEKLAENPAETRGGGGWTVDLSNRPPGRYLVRATFIADPGERPQLRASGEAELYVVEPASTDPRFPFAMQLTPLPHEGLPIAKMLSDDPAALRHMIDNLIAHGVTTLHVPIELPEHLAREVESYAQSRGMTITLWWFSEPAEVFKRNQPAEPSLYSPQYEDAVRRRLAQNVEPLSNYPRLLNVFAYQDEPFHQGGEKSFGYTEDEQRAFRERHGYELPPTLDAAKADAKTWLDVLNFRSDYWPVGWRKAYALMKETPPLSHVDVAMNHDSHNTFGGGAQQEAVLNVDDVFHWGGDFADMFSFDIYPYLMKDFRYGPNRAIKLPRMAQTHFAFAQMRNLTYSSGKKLGFWVGTYNPEWYALPPEGLKQYWMEREMAYTAVANGADFLIGGIGVPVDQHHWDDLGDAINVLHKVGPQLLKTKKLRARAAMLLPRTQMLQTQEEYWNVAQSFEAFQRAFGELDVIHEEQVAAGKLDDYQMLLMWDIKLLPAGVADRIAHFAESGGVVIADCVPNQDELRRPTRTMEQLFGVSDAKTDRILWPIVKKMDDPEVDDPASMKKRTQPTVPMDGEALGRRFHIPLVSARPCKPVDAEVLLSSGDGSAALGRRTVGKGRAYLLGFCLQDTSFQAWQNDDRATVDQINALLAAITTDSGVRSHVRCSNPDVEAAVRANGDEAFVFVIAHEPVRPEATIMVRDLPFEVGSAVDVETGQTLSMRREGDAESIEVTAPTGSTKVVLLLKR